MTGFVVFAHGSSIESANDSVRAVAAQMARSGKYMVETAFLENAPRLPEAVAKLIERGATRVVVIPYFLTLGVHLQNDLPRIVDEIAAGQNGIPIEVTPPLEGHPALVQILLARAVAAKPNAPREPA